MNLTQEKIPEAGLAKLPANRNKVIRLSLAIFLPVFAISAAVTATLVLVNENADNKAVRVDEGHTVEVQSANILSDLWLVSSDLVTLAHQNKIGAYWDEDGVLFPEVRKALEEQFLHVSANRRLYDQVRLIDEHGMETVRVNFNSGEPKAVAEEFLQSKKGRYYFDDAIRLEHGELFISPFDLNIEQGEIEQPIKPMIRVATPVFDSTGEKRGIVLINYLGAKLLKRFQVESNATKGSQAMLLNSGGYWLLGPNPEDDWGFMYDDKGDKTFIAAYPDAWKEIQANQDCQFETASGLFTSRTVDPLLAGQTSSSRPGNAFTPSKAQQDTGKCQWKIVSFVPAGVLYSARNNRRAVAAIVLAVLSLVAFCGAWLLAATVSKLTLTTEVLKIRHVELAQSNKELEDFTYVASHDLKEPLRGISRYSTILLEDYAGKLDEDGVRMLKTLPRLTKRLEYLIDDMLSFTRIGRLELAVEDVDLDRVLSEVIGSLHIWLDEQMIEIRRPRPLPVIRCDSVWIADVFQNLITNAMKYNDKDKKWIEIGWQDDHPGYNGTVLFVRDNGIGIPKQHHEKVFTMFKRLHARDKYGGGTGAGMTIVKKIIDRHNGKIWLESQVDIGTTFFFTLNRE